MAWNIACCGPPVEVSEGDLKGDGIVNIVDEAIFRRLLAGLSVWLPASGWPPTVLEC